MKWFKIPQEAMESESSIQLTKLAGHRFCLIYEHGEWHATSAKCPHAGANLANGWCEEGRLVCPYHRQSFDLSTGKGAHGQNNYISVFRLQKREDGMYIELPQHLLHRITDLFE